MRDTMQLETAGLHPATELFLEALQWLQARKDCRRVLDMGCGNGILSVVAAGAWGAQVLAVDIAEKALADTARNAAQHGLSEHIATLRSDGFSAPEIAQSGPYDLIMFNVLAELVVAQAQSVKANLASGGVVILGGILEWKAADTRIAYESLGFEIIHKIIRSPWFLAVAQQRKNTM